MIFQCITAVGWSDMMYRTQDAVGWFPVFYFCLLEIIGQWVILNLAVAVLGESYNSVMEEIEEKEKVCRRTRLSDAHPFVLHSFTPSLHPATFPTTTTTTAATTTTATTAIHRRSGASPRRRRVASKRRQSRKRRSSPSRAVAPSRRTPPGWWRSWRRSWWRRPPSRSASRRSSCRSR